jgi:hypothetical protein
VLIYPASARWNANSETELELFDGDGTMIAAQTLQIPCSGSVLIYPSAYFSEDRLRDAGEAGYVLIRDTTCRLFGFHGVDNKSGGFSFDHMFGF